jgi:hypothetical protein
MLPVAQKAAAEDITILERQMEGHQQRLDLWYGRVWDPGSQAGSQAPPGTPRGTGSRPHRAGVPAPRVLTRTSSPLLQCGQDPRLGLDGLGYRPRADSATVYCTLGGSLPGLKSPANSSTGQVWATHWSSKPTGSARWRGGARELRWLGLP